MPFIPSQVADITVNWLNDVSPKNVGKVDSFTITRFGTGVGILGELARLHLTYVDGRIVSLFFDRHHVFKAKNKVTNVVDGFTFDRGTHHGC